MLWVECFCLDTLEPEVQVEEKATPKAEQTQDEQAGWLHDN